MSTRLRKELEEFLKTSNAAELLGTIRAGKLSDLDAEEKKLLLHEAARLGKMDVLRILCEQSHVITHGCDSDGRDLLHYAAMSDEPELVAYVVETLGYDPLRGDQNGETPLDTARRCGCLKSLDYLEEYVGFALENTYRNPVRRGFYPDPSVVRVGEDFYMVNSTFVQFPCLPISRSRDLVHWHTIGHAINVLEWAGIAGLPGGYGYWAPDISYYKGRFWVIATLRRDTPPYRLQMITSSAKPEGPYDQPLFLDIDGIDPSLFLDDDGRRYVVINPGAQIAEINDEGELITKPQMIYLGSARVKTEGPHLLKKDGWYYLFQAEGGTGQGHMETVARSKHLRGPYTPCPFNPVLGRKEENAPVRRSGHGKPIQLCDGRWYMIYLCGRDVDGKTVLGRETALDPMTWTAEGWPMVNGLKGPSCLQRMPLPAAPWHDKPFRQEDWITPRGDIRSFVKTEETFLRITAGGDPAGLGPAGLVLRRQSESSFVQSVQVDVSDLDTGLCGLIGYYDENSFFLYGVQCTPKGRMLVLEEQIGKERLQTAFFGLDLSCTVLRIEGRGLERRLMYLQDGEWQTVAVINTAYLSDEGVRMGKRFTGATLGLAAVGNGEAVFSDYQEQMEKDRLQ